MWRFDTTVVSSGENLVRPCAGGLTITTQVGTSFSGTFFVSDPNCGGGFGGTVVNGVLNGTAVTFELTWANPDPFFMASVFGCTYVSGDRVVTGTLVSNRLEAQARLVMNCADDGLVNLLLQLGGTK